MELKDLNNFVQAANEEQLKAFGFLGQWMMENVPQILHLCLKMQPEL